MNENKQEHPIQGMMGTAMQKIREMIDVNTIIGDPITTPDGTVIIPVSKVSFGFGSGGSDWPNKNTAKDLFGGGAGAGISINPLAFLVISNGEVKLLQMSFSSNTADKMVNMVPDVIDKISGLVSGSSKKDAKEKKDKDKE
ncbi:MAG: GerW family sporulation protein [Clostridiales bacterium]|nr:GerW family sporulation protein [Clostridiales bacterium]